MDQLLQKNLEENYELRLEFVSKIKESIQMRLVLVKIILILLLAYLILVPDYLIATNFLGSYNASIGYKLDSFVEFFPVLFIVSSFIIILIITRGKMPFRYLFFTNGIFIEFFFELNYDLLVAKFIGLLILVLLPTILQKYNTSLKNYSSYNDKFLELLELQKAFDGTIKHILIVLGLILSLSYLISIIFVLISVQFGYEVSIVVPLLILPVLTVFLFMSPQIFPSLKKLLTFKSN